jgi:NSS family neurotransmitter:Na+ symporter
MFVAQNLGVAIYGDDGSLVGGPGLIFQVLPTLFESMGGVGLFVGFAFFVLMSIAAVTSSISMLEVPGFLCGRKSQYIAKKVNFVGIFCDICYKCGDLS